MTRRVFWCAGCGTTVRYGGRDIYGEFYEDSAENTACPEGGWHQPETEAADIGYKLA